MTSAQGSHNLSQALSQAAETNKTLLQTLAQTDYAKASCKSNAAYIADLTTRIAQTDKELKALHNITEDERKDHVKYRESTVKRFVYKLGGSKGEKKFSDKASKEEREFVEAWQKERERRESREELDRALKQAEQDRVNLEADKGRNDKAQAELDALYQSIFGGPTPELPGEDQLEEALRNADQHFQQSQHQSQLEAQAFDALKKADSLMHAANMHMEDALGYSRYDLMGGGTFADYMEREALSKSQSALYSARQRVHEAASLQPAIHPLHGVEIDEGHLVSDMLFDNIFTDMAQHDRMKNSSAQIARARQDLVTQLTGQRDRAAASKRQAAEAAAGLESARKTLQDTRAQAFEQYGANNFTAPPAYQAV